jgi:hypothetical protein
MAYPLEWFLRCRRMPESEVPEQKVAKTGVMFSALKASRFLEK